jgi:hypothetical protein
MILWDVTQWILMDNNVSEEIMPLLFTEEVFLVP